MKSLFRMLWLLLPALLMTTVINAQVYTGVRGGVGLTKWHYDQPENADDVNDAQDYLLAPYAAIPFEVRLSPFFSLQPELSYMQKGTRVQDDFSGGGIVRDYDFRARINYLNLPVLGKGMIRTGPVEIFALAGPEIGYALSGKFKYDGVLTDGEKGTIEERDIDFEDDHLSRFDFGLIFGAGMGLDAGPGKIVLDARYDLGLFNLSTLEESDNKVYNRGFGFSMGYMVPLGQ